MKLLYVVNDAAFFLSHRAPIARAAIDVGHEVIVALPRDGVALLEEQGFEAVGVTMDRGSLNPYRDFRLLRDIQQLIKTHCPDVMHLITAKAIIYGGIASRQFGVPALGAFSGMGYVFSNPSVKARLLRVPVTTLYKMACNRRDFLAIFQNEADRDMAVERNIVRPDRIELVSGSGTDLSKFDPAPPSGGVPLVMLPARMLRDKGVGEFVAAARSIREAGYDIDFVLQGNPDMHNPMTYTTDDLQKMSAEGYVTWRPHTENIAQALALAHLVVLPSYYGEGLPKTLIDAAAAGRAVVTTDMPGCRDAIIPGETGVLCLPRDSADLARCILNVLKDHDGLVRMGIAARRLAENRFDLRSVCHQHLEFYDRLFTKEQ